MDTHQIDQLINEAQTVGSANGWDMREKLQYLVEQSINAERKRCCSIIFGQCSSDNTAQRTVDAIWKGHK
jgi:hypothetical protein